MSKFITAEEYFNSQPENVRNALMAIRDCIYAAAPHAIEMLNYNIPAYALVEGGKREQQIMIAGYKKHVGLYPHPTTMEKFADDLETYKVGKGSVQFPVDRDLPRQLIIRMVRFRLEFLQNSDGHEGQS